MDEEAQQATTSPEPRPKATGTGKRRAVAADEAANDAALASGAVATTDKPTGEPTAIIEDSATASTTRERSAGKAVVTSPPRPGVLRLGADKRARAAPRVTAYALAMVKGRVQEIFNEMMASPRREK